MALNDTEAEQRQQANIDLKKKFTLEKRVRNEFTELFRVISADLTAFYATTGQIPPATVYTDDVRGILSRHYRRVSNAFSGRTIDFLKENESNTEEASIAILAALAISRGVSTRVLIDEIEGAVVVQKQQFITQSVNEDTANIITTNGKETQRAVDKSRAVLVETLEREPTQVEVGRAAGSNFRAQSASRPQTIAVTTTQKGSEGIKNIERNNFFRVVDEGALILGLPPVQREEVWKAVLDTRTRMSHAEADGLRKLNGFFTVQNQQLRFPGDRALGATADNVINCRCSAILRILE